MNEMRFEAEIVGGDAAPRDVVRELAYGDVRITAEWPEILTTPELRVAIRVRGDVDRVDAPAYVELFFHDVFLILNLSSPGTFAGTISITGGELRARELTFSARVFEYARDLVRIPVDKVIAWYEGLHIGASQLAESAEAIALFQLLHLARREEDEEESVRRLAIAAKALGIEDERLFAMRTKATPPIHPMNDDGLDPRVEDATLEWTEAADAASTKIIQALQAKIVAA